MYTYSVTNEIEGVEKMFCKNCGKEIDDNAVVCPNCGVATEKMQENAAAATNTEAKKTNVMAIIGFVLSLVSGVFSNIPTVGSYIAGLAWVAALVLCILGIKKAKEGYNLKGLAVAGLVLCIIDIVLIIIGIILVLGVLAAVGGAL